MADLSGTPVAAPIVPGSDKDTFPTHDSIYGKGGYREVATLADRDAIPGERRRAGMMVVVTQDATPSNNRAWRLATDGGWEDTSNNTEVAAAEAQAAADAAALAERNRTDAASAASQAALDAATANAQRAAAELARVLADAAADRAAGIADFVEADPEDTLHDFVFRTLAGWVRAIIRRDGGLALNHVELSPATSNGEPFEVRTAGGLQLALIDLLATRLGGGNIFHTGRLELANGLTIDHDPADTENVLEAKTAGGLILAQLTRAGVWRVKGLEAENLSSAAGPAAGVDAVARNLQRYPLQSATVRGAAGLANWTLSDGTQSSFDQKMLFHTGSYGVSFPQLEWINVGDGHPPVDGPNQVTLRASIEYPAGIYTPIWWENGSRDITIQPGAWVRCLPVPVFIPPDTDYWVHQYVQVPAGGKWVRSAWGGIPTSWASPGLDRTMGSGGAYTDSNQLVAFGPSAVVGKPIARTMLIGSTEIPVLTVEIIGDSVSTGTGDGLATGESAVPPRGCGGFIGRALWALKIPFIHNGKGGNSLSVDGDRAKRINRMHAQRYAKAVICNLGTNDSRGTLQDFKDAYQRLNADIVRGGGFLIPCTMGPRTNATNDGPLSGDTTQMQFVLDGNAWVRTDPFGAGYIDHHAAVANPSDPTRWNPSFVIPSGFDGLHPMPDAHLASANALIARLPTLLNR